MTTRLTMSPETWPLAEAFGRVEVRGVHDHAAQRRGPQARGHHPPRDHLLRASALGAEVQMLPGQQRHDGRSEVVGGVGVASDPGQEVAETASVAGVAVVVRRLVVVRSAGGLKIIRFHETKSFTVTVKHTTN